MISIPWEFWVLSLLVIAVVGYFIGVWMNQSASRENVEYHENLAEVYKVRYQALEKQFKFKPMDLEADLLAHIRKYDGAPKPDEAREDYEARLWLLKGLKMALVILRGML